MKDNCHPRGLVLEGGGAKGAYGLGCLLALAEKGIRFDVVAGTSVGALNAALWSSGKLEEGRRLYESLTLSGVGTRRKPFAATALLFLLNLLPYSVTRAYQPRNVLLMIACGSLLATTAVAGIVFGHFTPADEIETGVRFLPLMVMLGALGASTWLLLIPYVLREKGFSLLRTLPLASKIHQTLDGVSFAGPVYATMARQAEMVDPDPEVIVGAAVGLGRPSSLMRFEATNPCLVPDSEMVPEYVRLDRTPEEQRTNVLLASAALPYAIFAEPCLGGEHFVDGGVVDNAPVYPLAAIEHCKEIVIVRLRPARGAAAKRIEKERRRCGEIHRSLEIARLPREQKLAILREQVYKPPGERPVSRKVWESVRAAELPSWPLRIIEIAPGRGLGGFFTGTMNFRPAKARAWMALGYTDALRVIEESWPSGEPIGAHADPPRA